MARAQITTIQKGISSGLDLEAADAAVEFTDGNSFVWAPNRVFHILNGAAVTVTVTIPTPGTVGKAGLAIGDASGTILTTARKQFGPFGREFVQSTGLVHVDFTAATAAVMIAVVDNDAA